MIVRINAILSASSLEEPAFSPSAFAHTLQSFLMFVLTLQPILIFTKIFLRTRFWNRHTKFHVFIFMLHPHFLDPVSKCHVSILNNPYESIAVNKR